jgi:hypothetical protein
MDRYIVTTRLKPGTTSAAEELLSAGPPFDPADAGLSAHAAYLADDRVFLVFEGEAAREKALELAKQYVVEVTQMERAGLEPATSWVRPRRSPN